jgi:hypothetical protein
MQIHEITLVQEGILSTIGSDIKNVVTSPFQKAGAVLNTPGAMTSATGYASAMDKYYQGQVAKAQPQLDQARDARLAQQTQQRAQQLAQQWIQQVNAKKPRGPIKASPSAPTPLKPTGQYATNRNAGQVVNPTPAGVLPEAVAGAPTSAELAKYQQKVAAAANPKTGFGALPGAETPPPGKVNPAVTANPKTVMTGTRANEFKSWVNQQLASPVTGTNQTISLDQVRKDPAVAQQLAQLLPAIIMKNDPTAVEQYLTIAMQAMQKMAAQIRQAQQTKTSRTATTVSPLSMLISPENQEKIRTMVQQDPVKAAAIKQALGFK